MDRRHYHGGPGACPACVGGTLVCGPGSGGWRYDPAGRTTSCASPNHPHQPQTSKVGDLLDRGDQELPLLYWLERLQGQAAAAGGALHVLNGNHESMNVCGAVPLRHARRHAQVGAGSEAGTRLAGEPAPVPCASAAGHPPAHTPASGRPLLPARSFKDWLHGRTVEAALKAKCGCEASAAGLRRLLHLHAHPHHTHPERPEAAARTAALEPGGEVTRRFPGAQPSGAASGQYRVCPWRCAAPPRGLWAGPHQSGDTGGLRFGWGRGRRGCGGTRGASALGKPRCRAGAGAAAPHARPCRPAQEWIAVGGGSDAKPKFLSGRSAVVWSRHYSAAAGDRCDCGQLAEVLGRLPGAARMVVGPHHPGGRHHLGLPRPLCCASTSACRAAAATAAPRCGAQRAVRCRCGEAHLATLPLPAHSKPCWDPSAPPSLCQLRCWRFWMTPPCGVLSEVQQENLAPVQQAPEKPQGTQAGRGAGCGRSSRGLWRACRRQMLRGRQRCCTTARPAVSRCLGRELVAALPVN